MLRKIYHLTVQGEKEIYKAASWMTLYELFCALTVLPIFYAIREMIQVYTGEKVKTPSFSLYVVAIVIFTVLIFWSYKKTYKVKYISAGKENGHLRMAVADKLRKLPEEYLSRKDLSDLASTIMDDIGVIDGVLTNTLAECISGVASGVVILIGMAFINIKLTLWLAACLPLAVIAMGLSNTVSGKTNRNNRRLKLEVTGGIQEYLENIKALRSSDSMGNYQKMLERKINRIVPRLVLYEFWAGLCVSIAYNIMRMGIGFVTIYGAKMLISGEITPFVFLAFLLMSVRVYEPLSQAAETLGALINSLVAAKRIGEILDHLEMQGTTEIAPISYDIEFKNVDFGYEDEAVLKDVSFVAKQGEYTALVGPSGSGKSTITKLAARFWDADTGTITVGGVDVSKVDPETLFKLYSIVFQNVTLFHDTIYNNILVGNKNATREEVLKAAKDAQCMSFIEKLPDGIDTVIGENGHTLSGGERQRLSIARAFLKNAPIVLLDESTASLDPETETSIQIAIERLTSGKTVLMIAHRLRTVEGCNQIVVLEEGKVVGKGKHSELMNDCECYIKIQHFQKKINI